MPAPNKSMLTATSIGIPVEAGRMVLGTWRWLYVVENYARPQRVRLIVSLWDRRGLGHEPINAVAALSCVLPVIVLMDLLQLLKPMISTISPMSDLLSPGVFDVTDMHSTAAKSA